MCEEIELISYPTDSTPAYLKVLADKLPIAQSEFFAAGQNDIRPTSLFVVWAFEYNGETQIRHAGHVYSVYRTYPRKDDKIELYCEVRRGGH